MQLSAAYWQGQFRPLPVGAPYGWVAHNLPVALAVGAVTLFALFRFLGSAGSLAAGFVALAGLKICGETFERVFAVHHQDFYQGGIMLLGAVVGETYARMVGVRAEADDEQRLETRRFGMTGTVAMLGASYMAAGTSKLLGGGVSWATSSAVRLMILSHSDVEGGLIATAIPNWAADSPYLCIALEFGTLIVQLGGFMLIVGPRARRLWAALIVAFHAGIYVTSHILFLSPMLFAAVVAIPWSRILGIDHSNLPGELEQQRPASRQLALVALAFGMVAAMRIGHGW